MYRALLLFQNFVTVFNNLRNADSDDALETVWEIWLKIIECAAIIMIGLALSTLIRYLIRKAFRLPSRGGGKSETLSSLLQNFVKYGFWFFIVCQLLTTFGVAVESVLAVAGIGSVAIGFGAQTVVKDVITGMFILLENQYNIGDIITVNGLTGEIESLGVRTTKIRNINGNLHILPNSAIVAVTNMSRHYRRPTLNLDFPNAKPVDYILEILNDEMLNVPDMPGLISQPRVIGIIDMTPTTYKVQIQAESQPGECWPIERELRLHIRRRLEKEGM